MARKSENGKVSLHMGIIALSTYSHTYILKVDTATPLLTGQADHTSTRTVTSFTQHKMKPVSVIGALPVCTSHHTPSLADSWWTHAIYS